MGELYEGRLAFDDAEHRLPVNVGRHAVHGMVFSGPWEVEEGDARRAVLERDLGPEWPFGGVARQTIELDPDGITQHARVVASGRRMPAGLGWHPWFQVPEPSRTRLAVDASRYLELDDELIPTGLIRDVEGEMDLREAPILGDRRIDVVYVGVSSPARLILPGRSVEVSWDPAISILVVYAAEGTICIEPWTMWPDGWRWSQRGHDTGVEVLAPRASLARWMRWRWARE